jgi:ribonuclease P protein component
VKRWLREAFRRVRSRLPAIDVVAIARPSAAEADYAAIRAEVDAFADAVQTPIAG